MKSNELVEKITIMKSNELVEKITIMKSNELVEKILIVKNNFDPRFLVFRNEEIFFFKF